MLGRIKDIYAEQSPVIVSVTDVLGRNLPQKYYAKAVKKLPGMPKEFKVNRTVRVDKDNKRALVTFKEIPGNYAQWIPLENLRTGTDHRKRRNK